VPGHVSQLNPGSARVDLVFWFYIWLKVCAGEHVASVLWKALKILASLLTTFVRASALATRPVPILWCRLSREEHLRVKATLAEIGWPCRVECFDHPDRMTACAGLPG
jgi:hypothetical protein